MDHDEVVCLCNVLCDVCDLDLAQELIITV